MTRGSTDARARVGRAPAAPTRHVPSTTSWRANRRSEPCRASPIRRSYASCRSPSAAAKSTFTSTSWLSMCGPGVLACSTNVTPSSLAEPEPHEVAVRRRPTRLVEQHARRLAQLDHRLGGILGEGLADADVPGHPGPPPRVDLEARRGERLDLRLRIDARFVAVADVLAAHEGLRVHRPHGGDHLGLLVLQEPRVGSGRWLHRQQRDHLQEVVLQDVADRADRSRRTSRAPRRRSSPTSSPARCARSCGSTPARASCWRSGTRGGPRPPPCRGSGRCGRCGPRRTPSAASCSSSIADSRSRPNGFSTTIRPRWWRSTEASFWATVGNMVGGIAM